MLTGARCAPVFLRKRREIIIDNRYPNGNYNRNRATQNKDLVNDDVRFPQVLLIGPEGQQFGVMSSREAQLKANEYDLDLLCVAPQAKPPVCKIINYSKFRFEQQKKAKEARKNQHVTETKEVQLTPQIGDNDLQTKARAAIKFLSEGNKVKVGVRFRGRQMSHIEVGQETLNSFIAAVSDYASVDKPAAMDGRWLITILSPKKK